MYYIKKSFTVSDNPVHSYRVDFWSKWTE